LIVHDLCQMDLDSLHDSSSSSWLNILLVPAGGRAVFSVFSVFSVVRDWIKCNWLSAKMI
jgi:hypothetical protein